MSMPIQTLSSPSITSPSKNIEKSRDPSFSSYLNGAEETLVFKLTSPYDHIFLGQTKTNDTEIDVFDAKKYFDEGLNQISPMKKLTRAKTSTTHSQSSCNSQNALLHNVPKNEQPEKTKKKRFFARIGCNCSCNDKNSVEIEKFSTKITPVSGNSKQGVKFEKPENDIHFSFPVFNPETGNEHATIKQEQWKTWNGIATGSSHEIKNPSNSSNESYSDASSEFFEIENLSNGNPFFSSGYCAYAPSEASIEWSVITSSVADYSVLSGSEEFGNTKKVGVNSKTGRVKGRSGILSGCKSQKAVGVAGDGQRANV